MPHPPLFILTGWREAGKTTLCRRLAQAARQAGWGVAGLLSPARFENGVKTGIEVLDLRSDEHRLLASCTPGEIAGLQLGKWYMDPNALMWGNQVLQHATPCDILIIDELGPLEFDQQAGWSAGFPAIEQGLYRGALVVIRPEYLSRAQDRWPWGKVIELPGVSHCEEALAVLLKSF
jgi:hypothetical protein